MKIACILRRQPSRSGPLSPGRRDRALGEGRHNGPWPPGTTGALAEAGNSHDGRWPPWEERRRRGRGRGFAQLTVAGWDDGGRGRGFAQLTVAGREERGVAEPTGEQGKQTGERHGEGVGFGRGGNPALYVSHPKQIDRTRSRNIRRNQRVIDGQHSITEQHHDSFWSC